MKFDFQRVVDRPALQPIIDVEFVDHPGLTVPALLDSGASQNRFAASYADLLGIDLTTGTPESFTIAKDKFFAHLIEDVTLRVGRFQVRTTIGFVEGWRYPHAVLGIHGLFQQFSVRFEASGNYCALTRRP